MSIKIAENYAQALYELECELPSEAERDEIVRSFVGILKRNHYERLLPAVVRHLEKRITNEKQRVTIELIVAKDSDKEKYSSAITEHADVLGDVSSKPITARIDDSIIGGYVVNGHGVRVDASYRKHLLDLYSKLTANA